MVTHQQARRIAEQEVNAVKSRSGIDDLTIVDGATLEKAYAWIFFYASKRYIETGDTNYAVGGNGPLFISKFDGHISTFPTGLGIDGMMEEYEEQHRIWKLALADAVYADLKKLFDLKKILGLSNADVAEYKSVNRMTLDTGSETRLSTFQKILADKNIATRLLPNDYVL